MVLSIGVGTTVRHKLTGELGQVVSIHPSDAEVLFAGGVEFVSLADVEPALLDDGQRLIAGQLSDAQASWLRLNARLLQHSYKYDPGAGLSGARIEPQPHQAFIAHRVVARKLVPRMILADEVGLGKTIEAGLIIKELRARGMADRVLIVVPASLTVQWQQEMASKFNETFEIFDGAATKHFGRSGTNPFQTRDSVICSLPFASGKARAEQIVDAGWDLVIFDEAHRVRKTKSRTTQAYRLAYELQDNTNGLLLLSATPVQLHPVELFSLIDLVEPSLFASFDAYERQRLMIPELNSLMHDVELWPTFAAEEKQRLWLKHYRTLHRLEYEDQGVLDTVESRDAVMDRIIEAHPTADVMIRNRKAELGIGAVRNAHRIPVVASEAEREVYEDATSYIHDIAMAAGPKNQAIGFLLVIYQKMLTSSSYAIRSSFKKRVAKLRTALGTAEASRAAGASLDETQRDPVELSTTLEALEGKSSGPGPEVIRAEILVLESLISKLDNIQDSKASRLLDLLEDVQLHGTQKVVLFTQFIETQKFLAGVLEANGYKVSVFNGQMSADEKESAIKQFRERTQLFVSTEAGGEGRNLQFAHVLVNYDLPWNPMKVEQRIGRLDRIGQTHVVEIYNLFFTDTLEERIVDVLEHRIRIFEESVGSLDPILGEIEERLQDIALNTPLTELDETFERFGSKLQKQVEEAQLLERRLDDFVLDRASFRKDRANELQIQHSMADQSDLRALIASGLDYLGGHLSEHPDGGDQIHVSPRLSAELRTSPTLLRGIFDPKLALRMDELPFYACGHPLIDRILRSLVELENSGIGVRRSPDAPPGVSIEFIWELKATLVVTESRLVRHLVTKDGHLHSEPITKVPRNDTPASEAPDFSFAARAVEVTRERFHLEREAFRDEMLEAAEDVRARKLRRLERVHKSQLERDDYAIAQEMAFVTNAQATEDLGALKILPARKAKLEKHLERRRQRISAHEHEYEELSARSLDIRGGLFSVSILLGE